MSQKVAGRIPLALNSPHLRQLRELIPVTEQKENRNRKFDQQDLAPCHGSRPTGALVDVLVRSSVPLPHSCVQ